MREVMKRVLILNTGIIYPRCEVVPKKGGMTVVKNEKNELIPQKNHHWLVDVHG